MVELSLNKLKNDPIYFSENILGFTLHSGQKQILACKDRFIAVRAARRFGKSQCFAAYATWMAATNDNCRIVCVSKSKRQADELFQKIYQFIIHSILVEYLTRNTLSRIEFSNGSVIESLPSRTPDSLRGPTIHLILIDEAAYCDNSLFESIYPTILNVKGKTLGKLVMISSPRFKSGEFYKAFEPGSIFTPFHFTHEDAVFDDGSRLLPEEELEREAQRCGGRDTAYFKREYLAEFGNSDDAFFDTEGIDAALKPEFPQISFGIPGHKYVIGADLAQTQDYSVFIVLDYTKRDNLKVVHTCRFKGKNAPEIEKALYKEALAFQASKILIDEGNIGAAVVSHLKLDYPGYRWEGFNFNTASKVPLMYDLNKAMCSRILEIPDDDIIREELVSFYYEENPNTKHLKLSGVGAHDDYPIALALAIRAANIFTQRGGLIIGTNKGILSGKDACATVTKGLFV